MPAQYTSQREKNPVLEKSVSCETHVLANIYSTKGDQNMQQKNMLLWHKDYFELKAIKKQQTQKELFSFPLSA